MANDCPRLAEIKLEMAEKYERLARSTRSRPKQRQFRNRADKHRRQATEIKRSAAG